MDYNFVFSMDYGIGLILNETDGKYKIKYKNKIESNQDQFSFQFIDEKLASNLLQKKYESFFKYDYFNRGVEYANFGNVKNFYLVGNTIVGKVQGNNSKNYTQNITYDRGHFVSACSCPVEKNCKHVIAILIVISDIMNELISDNKIPSNEKLSSILSELKQSNTYPDQILIALSIKDAIKTIDDIEELLDFYELNKRRYSIEVLIELLAYNSRLNLLLSQVSYKYKDNKTYHEIREKAIRGRRLIDESNYNFYLNKRDLFIYKILSEDYYFALKYLLTNQYELKVFNKLLVKLSSLVDATEEIIDLFLEHCANNFNYNYDINTLAKNLLKNANVTTKIKIYKELGLDLDLSIEDISCFDIKTQLEILRSFKNTNVAIEYINNNFDNFLNYKKELVIALYSLYEYTTKNNKKLIISLLNQIEDTSYVIKLLSENNSYFVINNFDFESFFKYVDMKYTIKIEENYIGTNIKSKVSLYLSDDFLLAITLLNRKVYRVENGKIYIDEKDNSIQIIINKLFSNDGFIEEYNKCRKEIDEKNKLQLIQIYNEKINELNELLNYESYTDNGLVTLKPEIHFYHFDDDYSNENELTMELKIGRDKFYVVKSLPELLDLIREHKNYKYGKNLEFYHYINNFDDKSKELIDLLLLIEGKTEYSRYENPRNFPINEIVIEKLFEIYKDSYISINNKEYHVTLKEINFESSIDSKYILKSNIEYKNSIFTSKNIYYLNDIDNTIDKIITGSSNINLYEFLIKNNDMDVSLVLDKFKNDIYSRFSNEIVVPDELKEDYKLSMLIIDAYFDFDGKAIIINPKIYKENEEVLEMNIADKAKMDAFSNYINKLGFKDNKIINEDDIYNFLIMDFSELRKLCNVFLSDSLKNKTISKITLSNIRIIYSNTIVNAFLEDSIYTEEELYQILSSIKKRKKYVLLKDDRIVDINNVEATEFYDTVTDLKLDIKHILTKKQIPTYQVIKALSHQNNCDIDEYVSNMINEITRFKTANYNLPKINGKLRDYQVEGFNFLKILSKYNLGGILADDMGLGKTLEIITLLLSDETELPSLVVCPKSLVFNWLNEFEKFDGKTEVVCIIGNQNSRHNIENKIGNKKTVYIIAYNTLSNDLDYLSNINFNYIILDEAQYIKNVSANKTKSVKQLNGIHKFALTGTPIENNIIDLWSIFDFIMPDYLESVDNFKSKYMASDSYVDKVKIKVTPFILRRKKEDVLKDLPPKLERIISVDMTNTQRKLYDAYKLEANKAMEVGNGAFEMLPYITRLRQICVDPSTYLENYEGGSGKTDEILGLIDEYISNGHRILIFSSFVQALNIIEVNLNNKDIKYFKITGDTDSKVRLDLVNEFNENEKIKVFLISLKAGGTGLNLVGADTVIHMDPWWNVSAENQATDRAHRIGQKRTVEVIKVVCEESIEQRVIELQNIKKDLVDRVIAKDDSSITGFTLEDINYILR